MRSLIFLCGLLLAAAEPLRFEKSIQAMGTTYTIALYGTDPPAMTRAIDEALDEAKRLDDLLSNYKPSSEWSKVNREASQGPVKVSPELFNLISACVGYSRASGGAFDISVGKLMKTWGFYKGSGRIPHRSEIRLALSQTGWQAIELDGKARTVRFRRPGLEIDPGGIGKGYAVDRMVAILRRHGIASALVTGGGSSIYGLGAPPNEPRGWTVEIKHPKDREKVAATAFLKDMSMSTSGSYEKFFQANGRIYAHIFDPRTGYPAEGMLSVSVIAPQTVDSEAWTKPYFIQGKSWARSHRNGFRLFLCEDRSGTPCEWLQ
jgi:thiamine biosynthesis lipoprotein